jgi:hypothetical protein
MSLAGIKPTDHWHRRTNDWTCSRCRKPLAEGDVPLIFWSSDGEHMLIYCVAYLDGTPVSDTAESL